LTSLSDIYFIWSNEHNAWWGPNECGYSKGLTGAGEYTRDEAITICRRAIPTALHIKRISEIPVRRQDVMDFLDGMHVPDVIWRGQL
jgi:hypothetical protein